VDTWIETGKHKSITSKTEMTKAEARQETPERELCCMRSNPSELLSLNKQETTVHPEIAWMRCAGKGIRNFTR
jgi:hypothetical protein